MCSFSSCHPGKKGVSSQALGCSSRNDSVSSFTDGGGARFAGVGVDVSNRLHAVRFVGVQVRAVLIDGAVQEAESRQKDAELHSDEVVVIVQLGVVPESAVRVTPIRGVGGNGRRRDRTHRFRGARRTVGGR